VRQLFDRAGATALIGAEQFHWGANEAIAAAAHTLATADRHAAQDTPPTVDIPTTSLAADD
jgi:hypothetical protein